ncbi:hypothetical protein J6590_024413 [Homalodisca vitripennis]|nr:hypothetical protein J6590_024413 [Homalodisca vitripennis]
MNLLDPDRRTRRTGATRRTRTGKSLVDSPQSERVINAERVGTKLLSLQCIPGFQSVQFIYNLSSTAETKLDLTFFQGEHDLDEEPGIPSRDGCYMESGGGGPTPTLFILNVISFSNEQNNHVYGVISDGERLKDHYKDNATLTSQPGMPTMQDQEPIESWPTLDDFGKSKVPDIERTPTAVNPRVADRENGQAGVYPEYTAMARWPTLNGEAQTVREIRPQRPREESRERRSKTVREYSFRNKEGFDNPAYEEDNKKYYLRLQSDTGSTRDYEEFSPDPTVPVNVNRQRSQDRDTDRDQERDRNRERQREQDLKKNRERERSRERELERELPSNRERENYRERERNREREKDLQKNQRREIYMNSPQGEYRQKTPDPWNEKTPPPPPSTEYLEETEVPIPPVDYLDPQPQDSSSSKDRPMSLQEAILDRTLRLKKVPEALKKGF